jgi:hypothetical protein
MLITTFAVLLQAASPAGAATPAAAAIDDEGTITVTARRISDLEADVAACAAAPCPTRRDVAVSVAYASVLFDQGRYTIARRVLNAAVGRVKDAAAAEPIAVSQLYNAQANLHYHEGDQDIAETAANNGYMILRDHVGAEALPTLSAGYRLAQWLLRDGRYVEADTQFARISEAAGAAGHAVLRDACDLHRAQLMVQRRQFSDGFALLEAVAARDTGPDGDADMRRAALATAVRLANDRGEEARAEGYARQLAALGAGDEPLLLSTKPLPRPQRGYGGLPGMNESNAALLGLRWVDIGYWIRPDGSVESVEVLRGSQTRGWETPLLSHIAARRYAPTRGTIGHFRVERYTLTADYTTGAGSLIRKRAVNPRFEVTPLTGARPTAS